MIDRRKRASNAGAGCTGIVDKYFFVLRKGKKGEEKKKRKKKEKGWFSLDWRRLHF